MTSQAHLDDLSRLSAYLEKLESRINDLEKREILSTTDQADHLILEMAGLSRGSGSTHFRSLTDLAGMTWAGSPFIGTPSDITYEKSTLLVRGMSSGRAFLQKSGAPIGQPVLIAALRSGSVGYVGIRLDDGSDNNYVFLGLESSSSGGSAYSFYRFTQTTGGVTTNFTTSAREVDIRGSILLLSISGTKWSSWRPVALNRYVGLRGAQNWIRDVSATVTWTPTRVGIEIGGLTATWQLVHFDYFDPAL